MPFLTAVTSGLINSRLSGLPPPIISTISGIINTSTSTTITVNGSRFTDKSIVYVSGAATSNTTRAMTTTFVNFNQLTFTTNAAAVNFVSGAAFNIIVSNQTAGSVFTLSSAGLIDPNPVWTTAAGLTATFNTMSAQTVSHAATDPQGVTISLVAGAVPSGLSVASNGNIAGTVDWATLNAAWTNTYNYTLRATGGTVGESTDRAFSMTVNNSYYYRQVYSYAYFVGGYYNSGPHTAAHRVTVSNDTYAGLGNKLDQAAGYVGGAWGDTGLWVYGTGGALGAYSHYSGFQMFSESGFQNGDMGRTKDDTGVMSNHGARTGIASNYVIGGGEGTNVRHRFDNNTVAYVGGSGSSANYGNAYESDSYGYDVYSANRMNFTNESWSGMPSGRPPGGDQAHSKSIGSKRDFALIENGGNGSYTYTRHNYASETLQNNWTNKPQTCGETNFAEGQDWGYGMGCCGSACQNNWFWKQFFTSGASTWLGGADRNMSSGDAGSRRA